MVESDPDQGDLSPDRVLSDEEKDEGVKKYSREQPELFQEIENNSNPELFQETYNNSTACEDTEDEYLVLYYYNIKSNIDRIEEEKKRELFQNYYNNLGKSWFKTLMDYLIEYNAIMWETFSKVNPGFKQGDFYRGLQIIKYFIKKVKISDPKIISKGNQPKIYMWKWASPEDFHNEQARYAQILLEEKEEEREYIRHEQQKAVDRIEDERASKQKKRDENLRRVLEIIQPPIAQLTPLNEAMTSLQIKDQESRDYIRKHFVDRAALARMWEISESERTRAKEEEDDKPPYDEERQ